MACSQIMKRAGAVLTGVLSAGIVSGGMNGLAAEREASGTEEWKLSCAPQFDGLDCFETIVSTGKHPKSVKQPSSPEKSVPRSRGLAPAPQFDGLHCFETFIFKQ